MRKGLTITGLLLAGGLVLGACGDDDGDFDRNAAVEEMVAEGMSQDAAECFVDRMVDAFGEDVLASDAEPTAEQLETVTDITMECLGEG